MCCLVAKWEDSSKFVVCLFDCEQFGFGLGQRWELQLDILTLSNEGCIIQPGLTFQIWLVWFFFHPSSLFLFLDF